MDGLILWKSGFKGVQTWLLIWIGIQKHYFFSKFLSWFVKAITNWCHGFCEFCAFLFWSSCWISPVILLEVQKSHLGLWWWESYCVITWMCKTVHRSNYVGSLLALSFDFLVYYWHMTSIKLLYIQSVTKQCVSPCTMLQNHNIAWRNFSSLFLNSIKRGRG